MAANLSVFIPAAGYSLVPAGQGARHHAVLQHASGARKTLPAAVGAAAGPVTQVTGACDWGYGGLPTHDRRVARNDHISSCNVSSSANLAPRSQLPKNNQQVSETFLARLRVIC